MARDPLLRVIPLPADINTNGHIFGGWVLAQMDMAGGLVARGAAKGAVATIAIDAMKFIAPIMVHDVISIYGTVARRGRTSVTIHIEVIATRNYGVEIKVTEAMFTFVAIDEETKRPRVLPPAG